ncbi:efflux RND transporter periplasmic adaptor subunit [Falsirhodobacter xinxiangensis]|uniref:efflux RND transporter periplasmic adaptor subunit n=1 Tax=Falsirhodobacter xinxiangensis TaxID=2530049 RepID=UPI0010AA4FA8|nr:efflux RND transporter periplasmic adaptor subunit [Rhodobacter xinxiangensis]
MVKRLIIAVILLALVVGGIVGFNAFRAKAISDYFANMTPPPVPVAVEEARAGEWRGGIGAIGTSVSLQGVDLAVQAAGIVREVDFVGNDEVTKGALLIQIDERIELADLAAAEAELQLAEAELNRIRTLRERGVGAVNTLETQQAAAASARAQVARLTAVLEQKQLLAPFDGVIGIPKVEVGDYIAPGTAFATLQNLDRMQVDFSVPEQDIVTVKIGMPITASTEVGDLTVAGRIIAVEPRVDPGSRLVAVRAEVENTNRALLPGQFMRVTVELPPEQDVIALPQTAVSSNLYGDSVFIVREEQPEDGEPVLKVEQVFVQTGRRAGGRIEIREGVEAGDQVVIAGQNRLTSGGVVKIDNTVAPEVTAD